MAKKGSGGILLVALGIGAAALALGMRKKITADPHKLPIGTVFHLQATREAEAKRLASGGVNVRIVSHTANEYGVLYQGVVVSGRLLDAWADTPYVSGSNLGISAATLEKMLKGQFEGYSAEIIELGSGQAPSGSAPSSAPPKPVPTPAPAPVPAPIPSPVPAPAPIITGEVTGFQVTVR